MTIEIDEATKALLQKFGFTEVEQNNFCVVGDDNIEAHVDFRKENGRRWARKANGEFIKAKDIDTVPILKQFKEERDKLLQSQGTTPKDETASSLDVEPETVLNNQSFHTPPDVKCVPAPNANHKTFLDEIVLAYEIDIAELFGGAGEGKSQVVKQFALDAISQGKKVCFVDTERGFLKRDIAKLGSAYKYISSLKALMEFCKAIPKDIDLLIVDSVGYPVLTEWAKMGVNQRGDSLTQIIAIKDLIKDWAINNGKVAFVTNQPDSDFGKEKNYVNRPFGDKGQFVIKEVFKIERVSRSPTLTKSIITAFRSRHDGFGMKIADVEITETGVKFI